MEDQDYFGNICKALRSTLNSGSSGEGRVVARINSIEGNSQDYIYWQQYSSMVNSGGKPLRTDRKSHDTRPIIPHVFVTRMLGNEAIEFAGYKEMDLYVGDVLRTRADIMSTFRFLLGGRGHLDKGSSVQIISERDIKLIHCPISFNKNRNGRKNQIRIQEAGGVMGRLRG